MGNICPCFRIGSDYQSIHDQDDNRTGAFVEFQTIAAKRIATTKYSAVEDSNDNLAEEVSEVFVTLPDVDDINADFDLNLPMFKGMIVGQKFHNTSHYDPRFVWIRLDSRTLCLSEFESTLRKHKEARISDIVTLSVGPPEKLKMTKEELQKNPSGLLPNWDCYLSLKFAKGGSIDLKFHNKEERDQWKRILEKLMLMQQQLNRDSHVTTRQSGSGGNNDGDVNIR
jgi:hypothetical protein